MHPLAGKPAPRTLLADLPALVSAYYTVHPDPADPASRVSFGTSGHRGNALNGTFNEDHILAVTQAICLHRRQAGVTGPLYLGKDTHALSEPAQVTALEVLAANGVETRFAAGGAFTPTPSVSRAILAWNRGRTGTWRTASSSPPPTIPRTTAASSTTPPTAAPPTPTSPAGWRTRPTSCWKAGCGRCAGCPIARALKADGVQPFDFITPYVEDLAGVLDLEAMRASGLRLGADALGGAGLGYWEPIAERYGLAHRPAQRPLRSHLRASCAWTGTARSAWTAPRPRPWPGWWR